MYSRKGSFISNNVSHFLSVEQGFWICVVKITLRDTYTDPNNYRQTSNIKSILVDNKLDDHSDVAGASPVGAAPTTSSFWTQDLAPMEWVKANARRDKNHSKSCDLVRLILDILR